MKIKQRRIFGLLFGSISIIIPSMSSVSCLSDDVLARSNISEVQTYFANYTEQIKNEVQNNNLLKEYLLDNKIIQITTGGKVSDNSFNQMTWEAISEFSRNVGFDLNICSYKETKSTSTNEIHQAYADALNKGYKIWVLTGWQHSSFFQSWIQIPFYKQKFLDMNVKIISIDWDATQIPELEPGTCIALNFRTQESSFVIGYAISQFLNEKYPDNNQKMINTSAGTDTAGSTNFCYGFLEGIRAWNNDQTDNNKKIYSNVYKEDSKVFLDTTYEANNTLTRNEFRLSITGGGNEIFKETYFPTIVMPVAGDWSSVAADIIRETGNKDKQWVVGVDSNMAISYGPMYEPYFITSSEKRIGIATYKALCFLTGISQILSISELYPNSQELSWTIDPETNKIVNTISNKEENMLVNGGIELGFVGASPSTLSNSEDAKRFDQIIEETENKFFNLENGLLRNVDQNLLDQYNAAKESNNISEYNKAIFNLSNVLYGEMNANNKEYFNLMITEINRRE